MDAEATCVKEGSRHRSCSCGETEYDTISALGHDFSVEQNRMLIQNLENGNDYWMVLYKCSRCDETEYRNEPIN